MTQFVDMVEIWHGDFLESVHQGAAVVCDAKGDIVASWGDPDQTILPRSSCKMIQALPLVESGAADKFGLTQAQLALSCASHQGAALHVDSVTSWLADLDLSETDLRCGPQRTSDRAYQAEMTLAGKCEDKRHNNCSGKHSGFLTYNKYIGGDADYIEADHPLQLAIRNVTEDMADQTVAGYAIDGCSAPNFAIALRGLATSVARMAAPTREMGTVRGNAARSIVAAMRAYPELVAGKGRACTELMPALADGVVVKTGAEAVFIAILPDQGLGVALKIRDGSTRASECAIAALLVRLGVADADHPMVKKRLSPPMVNFGGLTVGATQPNGDFYQNGARL